MSDSTHPIRSYQRIFRPDRRIYAIDGRRLPVPGGVPLDWLGWAFASLIGVLVLSQRSMVVAGIVAGASSRCSARAHTASRVRSLGGLTGFVATLLAGVAAGLARLAASAAVAPGMIATLAGQASPGRAARAPLSHLAGCAARSVQRGAPSTVRSARTGRRRCGRRRCGSHPISTRRCFTTAGCRGPARLVFAHTVVAIPGRGRLIVRRAEGHRMRSGERLCEVVELAEGQVVEVRP